MKHISFYSGRKTLAWCGLAVLALGLSTGAWMWKKQSDLDRDAQLMQSENPSAPLSPLDSRKQVRDLEIYYGKTGFLLEKAEELFRGKSGAKSIVVASMGLSAALFLLARRNPARRSEFRKELR